MYYIFDMNSLPRKSRELYKLEELKDVQLQSFNTLEEIENFLENENIDDPDHSWWPVHDVKSGFSWVPVACDSEEAARKYILESENESIFMTIHDL